jgi:hypothetical protein
MKKKLTKAEMRIEIAKDVIAQIKAKKYNPMQGRWVEQADGPDYDDWLFENATTCKVDVRDYTNNINKCNVCALGSLFVSAVNKYNNVYGTYDSVSTYEVFSSIGTGEKKSPLLRYFSSSQLQLIEFTFEGGIGAFYFHDNTPTVKRAYDFHEQYSNAKDRLIAIMKNIIKNKGTFKP